MSLGGSSHPNPNDQGLGTEISDIFSMFFERMGIVLSNHMPFENVELFLAFGPRGSLF